MLIYLLLLAIILVFPYNLFSYIDIGFSRSCKVSQKKIYFLFITFLLILVAGLRSQNVGFDLQHHYASNYYKYASMPRSEIGQFGLEIGIFVLSKILGFFSLDVQWFIFITSLFSLSPLLLFFFKESNNFKICAIIFVAYTLYYQHLNQIQQQIAVSIVLIALSSFNKKHYFRYFCFTMLAATFHTSALITFAFILFAKMRITKGSLIFFLIGLVIALFGVGVLFSIVSSLFPEYAWYAESLRHGVGDISTGVLFQIGLSLILLLWSLYNIFSGKKLTIKYHFLTTCSYFYFISQVFTLNMIVLNRVGYYFLPFCIILCADNISLISNKELKILVKYFITIAMIFYFVYITVSWGEISYGVIPYEFF